MKRRTKKAVLLTGLALGCLLGGSPSVLARDYVVRRGDTLSRIAARHGTTVAELKALNGLAPGRRGDLIRPGQVLRLPDEGGLAGGPRTSSVASSLRTYVVVRGDSLSLIAERFGTTVDWLRRTNGISGSLIHPGDVLRVPGSTATTVPASFRRGTTPGSFPRVRERMFVPDSEVEVLARIVKGEVPAHSPYEGAVAVAAVVLNRVRSKYFPNSISGVVKQPRQFSAYNRDVRRRLYYGRIPDYAWRAAREALDGADPVDGATYYFNPFIVRPRWARRLVFVRRIGRTRTTAHDFYKRPGEEIPMRSGLAGLLRRTVN
ncbi:MAG: LysM peptidoglycan-binding domain-containing protein [Planctomycetota bacterium]|nr:MAG: LysM peptidoglycan-binding domain-containing protein [Planctomycetota bacterium]